jgi:hypothetical protein
MKLFLFCTALLFGADAATVPFSDGPTPLQRQEIVPRGKLRVGVLAVKSER